MASYLVTWSVDIDGVGDEREAAEEALKLICHPESQALCFDVRKEGRKKTVLVDLSVEEDATEELGRSTRRK